SASSGNDILRAAARDRESLALIMKINSDASARIHGRDGADISDLRIRGRIQICGRRQKFNRIGASSAVDNVRPNKSNDSIVAATGIDRIGVEATCDDVCLRATRDCKAFGLTMQID